MHGGVDYIQGVAIHAILLSYIETIYRIDAIKKNVSRNVRRTIEGKNCVYYVKKKLKMPN